MTAILVLPEADDVQEFDEVGQNECLLARGLHVPGDGQFRVEPEERTQRVVLGVRPLLVQFFESFAVEADMRAVHRLAWIAPSCDRVSKAVSMLHEEAHQRGHCGSGLVGFVPHPVRVRDVDVVAHPHRAIAGDIELGPVTGRRREQPRLQSRKPKRPSLIQECKDAASVLGQKVFADREQIVRHNSHAALSLARILWCERPRFLVEHATQRSSRFKVALSLRDR